VLKNRFILSNQASSRQTKREKDGLGAPSRSIIRPQAIKSAKIFGFLRILNGCCKMLCILQQALFLYGGIPERRGSPPVRRSTAASPALAADNGYGQAPLADVQTVRFEKRKQFGNVTEKAPTPCKSLRFGQVNVIILLGSTPHNSQRGIAPSGFSSEVSNAQRILCRFASMVGVSDGKGAGKTVLEASAANCAVLP